MEIDISAILSYGRRGQTANGMAHQSPGKSRSDSRASRSHVAHPCGVGVSFGSTLPLCVRVRVKKFWLTVSMGEVCSNRRIRGLLSNVTTVLPFWDLVGDHAGTFSGQSNRPATSVPAQRPPKWKDRSIIPGGVCFRDTVPEIYSGNHQQVGNGDLED